MKLKKLVTVTMLTASLVMASMSVYAEETEPIDTNLKIGKESQEEVNEKDSQGEDAKKEGSQEEGAKEEGSKEEGAKEENSQEEDSQEKSVATGLPTDLGWVENLKGYMKFKIPDGVSSPDYYIEIYKDGNYYSWQRWGVNDISEDYFVDGYIQNNLLAGKRYDFATKQTTYFDSGIHDSATYKYRMKVVEKEEGNSPDFEKGTVSAWSAELVYTQPSDKMPTPQNLHWKEGTTGVLEWDAVENAAAYMVALNSQESKPIWTNKNSIDLSQYFTDHSKEYRIVVSACGDGSLLDQYQDSDFSEEIVYDGSKIPTPAPAPNPGSDSGSNSGSGSSSSSSSSAPAAATEPVKEVSTVGNTKGWEALNTEIDAAVANAATGTVSEAVINVNLNGASEIPAAVLQQIAGKEVTVSFATGENVIVNISGDSLDAAATGTASISTVADKEGNANLQIRNTAADISKSIVIFQKAKPGMEEATLYFVDADGTLIPFRKSIVYENGYLAFETPFVNANYVIK